MEDLLKFRIINRLKSVYRSSSVDDRKENSAEHSWSCLLLADFFLEKIEQKIDRLKVYELLMYHDLVEVESGDTHPHSKEDKNNQVLRELEGAKKLRKKLPSDMSDKYWKLFEEFEEQKTLESKFAKAIDKLDAVIQEIDYKDDWKNWSREMLYDMKAKYFKEFQIIMETFKKMLDYFEEEDYFGLDSKD